MQEESSSECMAIFLLDPEDLDPRLRIAYISWRSTHVFSMILNLQLLRYIFQLTLND
jgi:hypothetical protein